MENGLKEKTIMGANFDSNSLASDAHQPQRPLEGPDDMALAVKFQDATGQQVLVHTSGEESTQDSAPGERLTRTRDCAAVESQMPISKEQWNESKFMIFRYVATVFSFWVMGIGDSIIGAMLPYIEADYHITYTVVSLCFLTSFAGYVVAAMSNNLLHHHVGRRGIAVIASSSRVLGWVVIAVHPPFAFVPVALFFQGLCTGMSDGCWNAWVGNMGRANELLGIMHGIYGLSCTIWPLVVTAAITKGGWAWYEVYYVVVGLAVLDLILMTTAHWRSTAACHRQAMIVAAGAAPKAKRRPPPPDSPTPASIPVAAETDDAAGHPPARVTTRRALRSPVVWLLSLILFIYIGIELTLAGWTTTFMLKEKHATSFDAGLATTLFWLGMFVGRVTLGFVTGRAGEHRAMLSYILLTAASLLPAWLLSSYAASASFVCIAGFWLGPWFQTIIIVLTQLLPPDCHTSAIGFVASLGGAGGALIPFLVGVAAQAKGIWVMQPFLLATVGLTLLLWMMLPGGFRKGGLEEARDNQEGIGHNVARMVIWLRRKLSP